MADIYDIFTGIKLDKEHIPHDISNARVVIYDTEEGYECFHDRRMDRVELVQYLRLVATALKMGCANR